ncbi:hypothetical protein FSARC_8604 [Fusarium sarcochroum]|uniref:Nucleoside phosphorylase domain-containing protein n=1 Tax=Fusarium sarcochroum TaxID=1208366 RepID=A0A8H4TSR0_9HYPO|nr:hypothetical protein FSARC_8604 [Fusarium sarcochroum]
MSDPTGQTTPVSSAGSNVPQFLRPTQQKGSAANQMVLYQDISETRQKLEKELQTWTHEYYTLAIVCALASEFEAVQLLFDDGVFIAARSKDPRDHNIYTVGRFAGHLTVLLRPGVRGELDAGLCTQSLHSTFRNIELTLLVGICGAVPEIRPPRGTVRPIYLGDVVFGTRIWRFAHDARVTQLQAGGVGIEVRNLLTERTPPMIEQLGNLMENRQNQDRVNERSRRHLSLIQGYDSVYEHPGVECDQLLHGDSLHLHRAPNWRCTCLDPTRESCSVAKETPCQDLGCQLERQRPPTEGPPPDPTVHIGTIASSDFVLRARDRFAADFRLHNVLGVDMEGGGVRQAAYSCIVIKAAVDYADTHKNRVFGHYAAAAAASVAKGFLETLFPPGT